MKWPLQAMDEEALSVLVKERAVLCLLVAANNLHFLAILMSFFGLTMVWSFEGC